MKTIILLQTNKQLKQYLENKTFDTTLIEGICFYVVSNNEQIEYIIVLNQDEITTATYLSLFIKSIKPNLVKSYGFGLTYNKAINENDIVVANKTINSNNETINLCKINTENIKGQLISLNNKSLIQNKKDEMPKVLVVDKTGYCISKVCKLLSRKCIIYRTILNENAFNEQLELVDEIILH